MLAPNPNIRISAAMALEHEYFAEAQQRSPQKYLIIRRNKSQNLRLPPASNSPILDSILTPSTMTNKKKPSYISMHRSVLSQSRLPGIDENFHANSIVRPRPQKKNLFKI